MQGEAIPRPLTDWGGRGFCGAAPYPKANAQYRAAFLSPGIIRSGSRAGGLMAADRPYPPLRGLTVCEGGSGCLES